MLQYQENLTIRTPGRGLHEITGEVVRVLGKSRVRNGLCVVFCRHTSASLLIQENADPTAMQDLAEWFARVAPDGDPNYVHDLEGPDDMAAHIRSAITRTSESIPVTNGRLALGTWQGIYLVEHRLHPHTRELVIHLVGL